MDIEDTPSVSDQTFDFVHRGRTVVESIELFDECHFGADHLRYRGTFKTIAEVKEQIKAALNPDFEAFGGGNPVKKDASSGIALNRYNVPDQKHWTDAPVADPYPNKAHYAVQFLLRLKTWIDFAYVVIGLPWNPMTFNEDGTLSENYPIEPSIVESGVTIDKLCVLSRKNISLEDANLVAAGLGASSSTPTLVQMTEEDAQIIDFFKQKDAEGRRIANGFIVEESNDNSIIKIEALMSEEGENQFLDL